MCGVLQERATTVDCPNSLTRREYYLLHEFANPCITDALFAINRVCSDLWRWGCAAAGAEAIVPHKGKKAGPLRPL